MWYPPFCEMVCVRFTDKDNETTRRASFFFKDRFGDINKIKQKIAILGPIPAGISKIKNQYRWQIIIKCDNADKLNGLLTGAMNALKSDKKYASVVVSIDKNPITIY
jgi:primosomal protein N' (replication factor Y)